MLGLILLRWCSIDLSKLLTFMKERKKGNGNGKGPWLEVQRRKIFLKIVHSMYWNCKEKNNFDIRFKLLQIISSFESLTSAYHNPNKND